jgi:hypothetical protein
MSREFYRVSIHKPFFSERRWAAGMPAKIRTETDVERCSLYSGPNVAAAVAALRQAFPGEVVTVY